MLLIHEKVLPEVINEIRKRYAKVAISSSGLSVTCRGEQLRYKHKDGKIACRKGFVKLHISVDVLKGTYENFRELDAMG